MKSSKLADKSDKKEKRPTEILKTEYLITENLITERYLYEPESKIIVSSNDSLPESLDDIDYSYRSRANLNLKDASLKKDSTMIINYHSNEKHDFGNYMKRRMAHHVKKIDHPFNAKVNKIFKKKNEDDEEERGKCSRCEIL